MGYQNDRNDDNAIDIPRDSQPSSSTISYRNGIKVITEEHIIEDKDEIRDGVDKDKKKKKKKKKEDKDRHRTPEEKEAKRLKKEKKKAKKLRESSDSYHVETRIS